MEKDLFGLTIPKPKPKPKPKTLFDDYDSFVKKFEPKKTTDDCYTPDAVYKVVLDYVRRRVDLTGKKILRPFYPGGDYTAEDYTKAVVVDNPPFSILSKIKQFYIERNIPFFLFAPTLTLFSGYRGESYIVTGANVVYENGANVNTSFVTNMWGDDLIVVDGDFCKNIEAVCNTNKVSLPKYSYPENIVSAALLGKISKKGGYWSVKRNDAHYIKKLSTQTKGIFGGGFLISNKAAAEKAAAEKVIIFELGELEKAVIKRLGG